MVNAAAGSVESRPVKITFSQRKAFSRYLHEPETRSTRRLKSFRGKDRQRRSRAWRRFRIPISPRNSPSILQGDYRTEFPLVNHRQQFERHWLILRNTLIIALIARANRANLETVVFNLANVSRLPTTKVPGEFTGSALSPRTTASRSPRPTSGNDSAKSSIDRKHTTRFRSTLRRCRYRCRCRRRRRSMRHDFLNLPVATRPDLGKSAYRKRGGSVRGISEIIADEPRLDSPVQISKLSITYHRSANFPAKRPNDTLSYVCVLYSWLRKINTSAAICCHVLLDLAIAVRCVYFRAKAERSDFPPLFFVSEFLPLLPFSSKYSLPSQLVLNACRPRETTTETHYGKEWSNHGENRFSFTTSRQIARLKQKNKREKNHATQPRRVTSHDSCSSYRLLLSSLWIILSNCIRISRRRGNVRRKLERRNWKRSIRVQRHNQMISQIRVN